MIVLINPPSPVGKISNKDTMGGLGQLYDPGASRMPPLDLPLTAACLRETRLAVTVIDCLGLKYDLPALADAVGNTVADPAETLLAMRTSLPTSSVDVAAAEFLKRRFSLPMVFFGPSAARSAEALLGNAGIDAVVLGEPERVLVELCRLGFEAAAGICFKDAGGRIVRNEAAESISDLDDLPFPAWELMPYKEYYLTGGLFPEPGPFLPVQSSRGCPFACHYCPYPVYQGRTWRPRTPARVVGELAYIVRGLGVRNVLFRDPEFTLDRRRTLALCEGIRQAQLRFHWRCETRIDTLDENLIAEMHGAGCIGINVGIETFSPEAARSAGRKAISIDRTAAVVRHCKSVGIGLFCFFMIGLPGQDKEEILRLIDFATRLDPQHVQFTHATPYPGTALHQWAEEKGYICDSEYGHYTGYRPVMRNEFLSQRRLKHLMRYARHAMHMRRSLGRKRLETSTWSGRCLEAAKHSVLKTERLLLELL